MTTIPDIIPQRFRPILTTKSWCVCGMDKIPADYTRYGSPLFWKKEREKLLTLQDLQRYVPHYQGFGFIAGEDGGNQIRYIDLDGCLEDGVAKNSRIDELLNSRELFPTFVEVSSSGNGLHVFFESSPFPETAIRSDVSKGKIYCCRFVKVTGVPYKGLDYPVKTLSDQELAVVLRVLGEQPPPRPLTPVRTYQGVMDGESWDTVLTEAGIEHRPAPYTGKERHGKMVLEAWLIPCPNITMHSNYGKPSTFRMDAAVLERYDDGTSSCTCNHNHCAVALRPNLLRLLWQEIKAPRIARGKQLLADLGVMRDGI
jgi:hypothetical protein